MEGLIPSVFTTLIVGIISWGFLTIIRGNREFFKLLKEFHEQLPPKNKKAREIKNFHSGVPLLDTTYMKEISVDTVDLFHKKLENFNYDSIFIRHKEIKSYSENLQRILNSSNWQKFGLATIQRILEDEEFEHAKPYIFGRKVGKVIGF